MLTFWSLGIDAQFNILSAFPFAFSLLRKGPLAFQNWKCSLEIVLTKRRAGLREIFSPLFRLPPCYAESMRKKAASIPIMEFYHLPSCLCYCFLLRIVCALCSNAMPPWGTIMLLQKHQRSCRPKRYLYGGLNIQKLPPWLHVTRFMKQSH